MDLQHRLPKLVGKFQSQLGSAAEHALKTKITLPSLCPTKKGANTYGYFPPLVKPDRAI
jgi:hypothetical protein